MDDRVALNDARGTIRRAVEADGRPWHEPRIPHACRSPRGVQGLGTALDFVTETAARGETILFVGTKKQAQEPISEEATRAGMPYVNQRWLGGMLTNFT